ncbi:hypothetical protein ACS0TY_025968 [Phlomoides rotata]
MEKDVCHRRKLDAISESKKRLDVARVLISVPFLNDVNQTFKADIEGVHFRIKILEEFDWAQDAIEVEKEGYQTGDEDDSCWSDESTDSFMLSLANATEHGFSEEKTIGGDEA